MENILHAFSLDKNDPETGDLEFHIHSVHHRVFTPDLPKFISFQRFSSTSPTKEQQKNYGHTCCNDVTATTTTINQYEHNNNNQFDPIILGLPHPITVLV